MKIIKDGIIENIAGIINSSGTRINPAKEDGNLATIQGDTTSIDGKVTACNTGAVVVSSGAITETNSADVKAELQKLNSLIPAVYDYIALSYTGDNLTTVVFKTGGAGGSIISTLTLAYTGAVLDSVTKT